MIMKNLIQKMIVVGLILTSSISSWACNSAEIKNQLQTIYNYKYQNVPYGQRRVESMVFVAQLKSNQKINVFAGGDDRDVLNKYKTNVEVYKTHVTTFAEMIFNAVLVDTASCKIISILNITSINQ